LGLAGFHLHQLTCFSNREFITNSTHFHVPTLVPLMKIVHLERFIHPPGRVFKVSHEKQKDLLAVTDVALIVRCRVDLDHLERSKTRWKVNDNLRHRGEN
jgi:hypothetical protein